MFIRSEIKMVMVFLPASASACPTVIARRLLLLTTSRKDSVCQEAEPATQTTWPAAIAQELLTANRQHFVSQQAEAVRPPVAWRHQVGCQAAQAVDSRLRPADRDFPRLALQPKLVSVSRWVSVKQTEQRMARGRQREGAKPALRVEQSDQQVPVFSWPNPQP